MYPASTLCFLLVYSVAIKALPHVREKCSYVADIVFALDSSASIHDDQFQRQLRFVESVIKSYVVRNKDMRFGLLTFSYHVYPTFNLSSFSSESEIHRAVQQAHFGQEGTHTDKAIAYASDMILSPGNGGRGLVPKILILITDGAAENSTNVIIQAKNAKAKGVQIVIISIGETLDQQELETVAISPASKFVLNIDSYTDLKKIVHILSRKKCKDLVPVSERQVTFVYDKESLPKRSGKTLLKSISHMVKEFDTTKIKIFFQQITNTNQLRAKRKQIFLKALKRNQLNNFRLKILLKKCYMMLTSSFKYRKHAVIVILSGKRLKSPQIYKEILRLSSKADVYILRLTLQDQEVDNKLCNSNKKCIYTVNNNTQLHEILGDIKRKICKRQC